MFLWFLFIGNFPLPSIAHVYRRLFLSVLSNPSMDPSHETPGKPSKTRCASPGGWRRGSGLAGHGIRWARFLVPSQALWNPTWPQQRHPKSSNSHQIGFPHHRWPTRADPHPSRWPPGASVPRLWWFNPMGVLWEIRTMDVLIYLISIDRRDSSTPVSSD